MPISQRTATSGTAASGAGFSVTLPASTVVGDLLVVAVTNAGTTGPNAPTGWTRQYSTSAGSGQCFSVYLAPYSASLTLSFTNVASAAAWACDAYWQASSTVWLDNFNTSAQTTNSTALATAAASALGNVAGDYVLLCYGWTGSPTISTVASGSTIDKTQANSTSCSVSLGHGNSTLAANGASTAFAQTLSATSNRKTSVTLLLGATPTPTVAFPVADDLRSGSLSAGLTLWGTGASMTPGPGGALQVVPITTGADYGGLVGTSTADFTGKYLHVDLTQRVSTNTGVIQTIQAQIDSSNYIEIGNIDGTLVARRCVSGTPTQVGSGLTWGGLPGVTWLRMHESGGVCYWMYSVDGLVWTHFQRLPNPITLTAARVNIVVGTYQATAVPGTAQFNYLNTAEPAFRNLTGAAVGVATVSQALSRQRRLSGTATGLAAASGSLRRQRALAGAAAGSAATSATLTKKVSGGSSPATTKPAPSDTVTFDSGNALAANLKIWLAMIETSGATLADSAGTPQNGTVAGTLTRVTGPNGGQSIALTTDNAQRIGLGDQPTHGLSTGQFQAFTFSMWVRLANVDFANKTLFTGGYFSDAPNIAAVPPYNLKYVYGGPGGVTSTAVFDDPGLAAGTWYHVCFTDSGADAAGAVKCYVNGSPLNVNTDTNYSGSGKSGNWDKNGTYGAFFGAEPFGDNWHPATYDSLMIFERALSAAEVSSLYTSPFQLLLVGSAPVYKNLTGASTGQATVSASPTRRRALVGQATGQATVSASPTRQRALVGQASGQATASATLTKVTPPSGDAYGDLIKGTSGLLAYYRLNESATGTATDSSSNARDGSYSGGGVYYSNPSPITSNSGNTSVAFDGASGRVALPSSLTLAAGSAITVEYWIKTITVNQSVAFTIGGLDAPSRCIAHCPWEDNVLYWDYGSYTTNRVTTNFASYLGAWTHVALTYGGGTQAIYLNGVQVASQPSTNTSTDTLAGGAIGQGLGFASISAYMDEFAVYNVALTPAQILAHYNAATTTGATYKNLTGSAAGSAATSASLTRERRLTAAAAGAASVSASPTRQRRLTAAAVGVALAAAAPTRQRRLVAAATGVASTLASPTRLRALVASAAGVASTLASPTRLRALLASASGSSSTTAFLSRGGTPQRDLLAIASGIASTSAALSRRRALVAAAVGVATSAASLTRRRALAAQAAGQATASGTISKSVLATGTVFWIGPPTAQFGPSGTVPLRWEGDQFVTATADPVVSFAGGQFDT